MHCAARRAAFLPCYANERPQPPSVQHFEVVAATLSTQAAQEPDYRRRRYCCNFRLASLASGNCSASREQRSQRRRSQQKNSAMMQLESDISNATIESVGGGLQGHVLLTGCLPALASWPKPAVCDGGQRCCCFRHCRRWPPLIALLVFVAAAATAAGVTVVDDQTDIGYSSSDSPSQNCSTLSSQGKAELFWRKLVAELRVDRELGHSLARALSKTTTKTAALIYAELAPRLGCGAQVSLNELIAGKTLAELQQAATEANPAKDDATEQIRKMLDDDKQFTVALNYKSKLSSLAQIAADNANLVAQLLAHAQLALARRLASARFFRYLLETKAASAMSSSGRHSFDSLGLVLVRPLTSAQSEDATSGSSKSTENDQKQYSAFVASRDGSIVELDARDAADLSTKPIFASRWLAPGGAAWFECPLDTQTGTVELNDGRWSSARLDCGRSNRWLVTYSAPVIASEAPNERPTCRGVSFVSVNLESTSLVNQCESEPQASSADKFALFAGTHQCARVPQSRCVPLPIGRQLRRGAYVCVCPASNSSSSSATTTTAEEATVSVADEQPEHQPSLSNAAADECFDERRRDELAALLVMRPQDSSSSSRTDPLADVSAAVDLLRAQHLNHRNRPSPASPSSTSSSLQQQQVNSYKTELPAVGRMTLGAQLEADAALCALSASPADCLRSLPQLNCGARCTIGGASCLQSASLSSFQDSTTAFWRRLAAYVWTTVLVVQVLSVAGACCLAATLYRLRRSRIIVASSWVMLESLAVGALLLYANVLVRLARPSSLSCMLEPWTRELGFCVFYGAILIKLYKIFTEFQTRKAHRVCFSERDLLGYLLGIVIVVVGYMSAWTALVAEDFNPLSFGDFNDASSPLESVTNELDNKFAGQLNLSQAATPHLRPLNSTGPIVVASDDDDNDRRLRASDTASNRLFAGLVELSERYDELAGTVLPIARCRRLGWDYVTQLSELAFLAFAVYLVYKLRNASKDVHKEKLVLSVSIFVEMIASSLTYLVRNLHWSSLTNDQMLLLYCLRCQITVTVILALVLGPKLWLIGKSKPMLLIKNLKSNLQHSSGCLADNNNLNNPTNLHNNQTNNKNTNNPNNRNNQNTTTTSGNVQVANVRHRCHISCEVHQHHLDDAHRLHQAMLSNSALDFGVIDLADMDPDEIQAELKRVYAQLEVLKTKVMRRDNPHISKRRGGKKPTHRKFSLQAFHPGRHHQHQQQSSQLAPSQQQCTTSKHIQNHHSKNLRSKNFSADIESDYGPSTAKSIQFSIGDLDDNIDELAASTTTAADVEVKRIQQLHTQQQRNLSGQHKRHVHLARPDPESSGSAAPVCFEDYEGVDDEYTHKELEDSSATQ